MVSSKDVAKLAGVSQSTVSRVLNDPSKVSKEAYEKVMKAVKELNYRPNSIARSLVKNKTKSIALISGPLHNPFFVETTDAIVNYAKDQGYHVTVYFEKYGDNMAVYEKVFNQNVDGIILSSILYEDPIYEELEKLNIPFVMFNRKHKKGGNFVEINNFQAGKFAAKHLVELGHQHIAWIGGSLKTSTFYGRYKGFIDQLTEMEIAIQDSYVHITDTSKEAVKAATESVLACKNRPTAIFAATDSIALFIMDYLLQKGYSIPEDISLIGMDNVGWSSHQAFQLTTVGARNQQNLGRIAIEHLIKIIQHSDIQNEPFQVTVEPELFIRRTTKAI
ncbi:LacI family DNA-binding transcriptional regulator [Bacillus alveayuensis]|jgi:DNA-binding LacI/PurR family transcriptional regulator|uniref:LacI family transcriptional regulator n=1 Tax=Aeribacillus alveayuensis TaxID=279215 RepID=A0ABT9VQC3_9BACI|nr:LacI family DNA-binding transcriptional regulator [Bacillus alveayuensis]MDQ0163166.1 LacI family transcriptional regulator [Bacillus alveayuensis]